MPALPLQIVSGQLVGTLFDLESSTKLLKELQEQTQGKQGEMAACTGSFLHCMCSDHTLMHWAKPPTAARSQEPAVSLSQPQKVPDDGCTSTIR